MDGGNPEKVEAVERERQNGNEERGKTIEEHFAQWVDMEYGEQVHENIKRNM